MHYYTEEELEKEITQCTIYESIYRKNVDYPDEMGLRYFNNTITFRKLFEEVENAAKALYNLGIRKGDVINLCVSATPETVYLVLACSRIGALANFINPLFSTEQKIARINETESKILFVLDKMIPYVEETIQNSIIENVIVIPATNSIKGLRLFAGIKRKWSFAYILFNEFIAQGKACKKVEYIEFEKDLPVVMVYSSGTTGASKGILLTNNGISATYMLEQNSLRFGRGERFLDIIPIWFSTGISLSILVPLSFGAGVVLEPAYSPENFAHGIKKYKPTVLVGTASLWEYAISSRELKKQNVSFIKCALSGGEPLNVNLENKINKFFASHGAKIYIRKGYGQCELGGTVTVSPDEWDDSGLENVGIPTSHVVVSSFDIDTNKEQHTGEIGEIRVLSPAKMIGYYRKPDATKDFLFVDDEDRTWARTGDIGYVRPDGKVVICGRASDSFISDSGRRIYLFDVKNCILQNNHIVRCEVVDVEIDGCKRVIVHLIVDNNDMIEEILRENDRLCEKLPEEARPYAYKVRDTFTLNPTSGKCDISALRKEREGFINSIGNGMDLY